MTSLPPYLQQAIDQLLSDEPTLRLTETREYEREPYSYAAFFEPREPMDEESHADLHERVGRRLYELLEERSLDLYWTIAAAPKAVSVG